MIVKFYTKIVNSEMLILPSQGDSSMYGIEVYEKNLELPIDFMTNGKFTIKKESVLLVTVDLKEYKAVELLDVVDNSVALNNDLLSQIKEYNKNIMLKNKTTNIKKVDIPNDIYTDPILWDFLVNSILNHEYPLLIGPKGCGKSSMGRAIAKALGYNFYPINCADLSKPESSLIGTTSAKDGSTHFNESLFLKHYTSTEKTIIYLQEMSRIPQNGSNSLTTITEQPNSFLYVKERGEMVYKGENVIFMGDANFGVEYVGTNTLDGAFFDRFTAFVVDYLPPEKEIKLLLERNENLTSMDATKLVKLANDLRTKLKENNNIGISTRKLLTMAKFLAIGFSLAEVVNYVFKNIFKNGTAMEDDEINMIFDSVI